MNDAIAPLKSASPEANNLQDSIPVLPSPKEHAKDNQSRSTDANLSNHNKEEPWHTLNETFHSTHPPLANFQKAQLNFPHPAPPQERQNSALPLQEENGPKIMRVKKKR